MAAQLKSAGRHHAGAGHRPAAAVLPDRFGHPAGLLPGVVRHRDDRHRRRRGRAVLRRRPVANAIGQSYLTGFGCGKDSEAHKRVRDDEERQPDLDGRPDLPDADDAVHRPPAGRAEPERRRPSRRACSPTASTSARTASGASARTTTPAPTTPASSTTTRARSARSTTGRAGACRSAGQALHRCDVAAEGAQHADPARRRALKDCPGAEPGRSPVRMGPHSRRWPAASRPGLTRRAGAHRIRPPRRAQARDTERRQRVGPPGAAPLERPRHREPAACRSASRRTAARTTGRREPHHRLGSDGV